jgi:hypothetical protein
MAAIVEAKKLNQTLTVCSWSFLVTFHILLSAAIWSHTSNHNKEARGGNQTPRHLSRNSETPANKT